MNGLPDCVEGVKGVPVHYIRPTTLLPPRVVKEEAARVQQVRREGGRLQRTKQGII